MTILTKIRNRSGLLVGIIAFALGGFILNDALTSGNNFFADDSRNIAEMDGKEVAYEAFEAKVDQLKENEKMRTGNPVDDNALENIRQQVWNQFLVKNLLEPKYEKLGLGVSSSELFDMVQGDDPHPSVKQSFTDPKTNQFDPAQVINYLKNMDKDETGESKARWIQFENEIRDQRVANKYTTMLKKGMYVTRAEAKRDHVFKNESYSVKYACSRFVNIPDSTIKVSEEDINQYYSEHKYKYNQPNTTRGIEYVEFPVDPSDEDRNKVLKSIESLKAEFTANKVESDSDFVNVNSDFEAGGRYNATYVSRNSLNPFIDTLFSSPIGSVFGPYVEGNSYKLSKLTAIASMPDSVKARHILIKPVNNDVAKAKAKADSLKNLITSGRKFDELATSVSEDPGSAVKGGDLGWFKEGMMVKPFNDACFNGKIGELQVVESQFGVHLIELLAKGPEQRKVLISTVTRVILPGSATTNAIYLKASQFAEKNKTKESFQKSIKDGNLATRSAVMRDLDRSINGIPNSREVVRWAFQASKGDVSSVFSLENKFIIALVSSVKDKGVLPLEEVREMVEAEAKKEKKADQYMAKMRDALKGGAGIDQIAQKLGVTVETAATLNFANPSLPASGREPELFGKLCGMKKGVLSEPIKGDNGVYCVVLESKTSAPELKDTKSVIDQLSPAIASRVDYAMFEALKKKADIVDNRQKFY